MFPSRQAIISAALFTASNGVSGFTVPPKQASVLSRSSHTQLYGIRCENKYYQLEEMEDKDNSTTELFLTADGRVEFGETDGPMWDEVAGNWHVTPGTDDFTMVIFRRFGSGRSGTDMGEFAYEIGRVYKGEMTKVGDSVAITGVMHSQPDEFTGDDKEVGFFNMIDGTDVREDRRADARSGVQSS